MFFHRNPYLSSPFNKSNLELAIGLELEKYFLVLGITENVNFRSADNRKITTDFFLPDLSLAIEIDGYYFHREEEDLQRDLRNTLDLNQIGLTVLRVRQAGLPSLSNYYQLTEIPMKKVADPSEVAVAILRWISRYYGFTPILRVGISKIYHCELCGTTDHYGKVKFSHPKKCWKCYHTCAGYGREPHQVEQIHADRHSDNLCKVCRQRQRQMSLTICPGYQREPHQGAIMAKGLCNTCYVRCNRKTATTMCPGYLREPHQAAIGRSELCAVCRQRKKRATATTICPGYQREPHRAAIASNDLCSSCSEHQNREVATATCPGYKQEPHLAKIGRSRLCKVCRQREKRDNATTICTGYQREPHQAAIAGGGLCILCYARKRSAEPATICQGYGDIKPHLANIVSRNLCATCYRKKRTAEATTICHGFGTAPHRDAIASNDLCDTCYHRKRRTESKLRRFAR